MKILNVTPRELSDISASCVRAEAGVDMTRLDFEKWMHERFGCEYFETYHINVVKGTRIGSLVAEMVGIPNVPRIEGRAEMLTAKDLMNAWEDGRRVGIAEAKRLLEKHPGNCNHKGGRPFCCDVVIDELRVLATKPNETCVAEVTWDPSKP